MSQGYSVKKLAALLGLSFQGNPDLFITGISTLEKAGESDLAFLFEEKYYKKGGSTLAGCLLVNGTFLLDNKYTFLIAPKPRLTMTKLLELFSFKYNTFQGVHPLALIAENVSIGENCSINPYVFIGENSIIGEAVTILPGAFIGDNSKIGEGTFIYPNVTILAGSVIGRAVIIHSGSVIGSDGFGFIQLENNVHYKVPQIGNVIIEDKVEIGSNVSIDRATIGSTIIGEGAKIDNLVHIAHNVEIGKRALVVAQVGIAGSSKIGDDSILAGQAGISGHLELGEKTIVLGRSGVTKDFPANSKISGFPAREHKEEIKSKAFIKKIPELLQEIEQLKSRLNFLESSFQKDKE